jgi:hypothetical protein
LDGIRRSGLKLGNYHISIFAPYARSQVRQEHYSRRAHHRMLVGDVASSTWNLSLGFIHALKSYRLSPDALSAW